MANKTLFSCLMRPEDMNSGKGYRVCFSYGTFSISPKKLPSGIYYYVYKRVRGTLYKSYVGKCGDITHKLLHQATMRVAHRIFADVGHLPA